MLRINLKQRRKNLIANVKNMNTADRMIVYVYQNENEMLKLMN